MNTQELMEQVIELQSRMAYQEDTIQTLNRQMARQADELSLAQKHIQILNQKLNDLTQASDPSGAQTSERPPHY